MTPYQIGSQIQQQLLSEGFEEIRAQQIAHTVATKFEEFRRDNPRGTIQEFHAIADDYIKEAKEIEQNPKRLRLSVLALAGILTLVLAGQAPCPNDIGSGSDPRGCDRREEVRS